MMLLPDFNLVF